MYVAALRPVHTKLVRPILILGIVFGFAAGWTPSTASAAIATPAGAPAEVGATDMPAPLQEGAAVNAAVTCTWDNASAYWSDAAHWSSCGGHSPGAGDSAIVNSGQVTITSNVVVAGLTLAGGTLAGSGDLTVSGQATFSGGTLRGLHGAGSLIIPTGAVLNISGAGAKLLEDRTIDNSGTVNAGSGSALTARSDAVINNSGAFNLTAPFSFNGDYAPPNYTTLSNAPGGTLTVAGTGAVDLSYIKLLNAGAVRVNSGTLNMSGTSIHTGLTSVAAGATLLVASGSHTLSGSGALAGEGAINVQGTLRIDRDFTLTNPVALIGGGHLRGSGNLTIEGGLEWLSGYIEDTGRLVIPAGSRLHLSTIGSKYLQDRAIDNRGTIEVEGDSILSAGSTVVIENHGTFRAPAPFRLYGSQMSSTSTTFANATGGVLDVRGPGQVTLTNIAVSNQGTLKILGNQSGVFARLKIGGSYTQAATGALEVEVGAPRPARPATWRSQALHVSTARCGLQL